MIKTTSHYIVPLLSLVPKEYFPEFFHSWQWGPRTPSSRLLLFLGSGESGMLRPRKLQASTGFYPCPVRVITDPIFPILAFRYRQPRFLYQLHRNPIRQDEGWPRFLNGVAQTERPRARQAQS